MDNSGKIVIVAGAMAWLLSFGGFLLAADQPRFEVASVKRTDRCGGGNTVDPRLFTAFGVPLKPVVVEAFKVKWDQIEGPSWLETDCFDISAKIPDGVSLDRLPDMLQGLLKERFKLDAHKEERAHIGYALVVDKGGPKCKEDDPKANFLGSHAGQMFYGHGALKGAMTTATLASNLSRQGYGPVQDLTGLTGKYDIDLSWEPNPDCEGTGPATVPAGADSPATPAPPELKGGLFAALREQLGLKLERRQIQVQIVVIDHIERTPTEN